MGARVKNRSGIWLCVALALFGAGVMLAFFKVARNATHPDLSGSRLGVPSVPLRFASLNMHGRTALAADLAEQIAAIDPDFLFLQQTHGKGLADLQRRLGGNLGHVAYFPAQNVPETDNDLGNAILSKYPLEEGRPIPNHMSGAAGVWASSAMEGMRFYVASMRLSAEARNEIEHFAQAWNSLGKPPMVAAVEPADEGFAVDGLQRRAGDATWVTTGDWMGATAEARGEVHCFSMAGRGRAPELK